ncbi:hypothetical protein WKI25_03490 [Acinetobacter baumannii]|uniref:hypothetical protein n=1 Tax=Acinetobacter baumannii TaxID=470 RepID=UPI00228E8B49|nr:hypothetical protein [Acinetobacter baumannii]MDC4300800.1 ester cyclase [Acinetobacter baumannii]MDC4562273.1 ester cyclase [Acinetobacter baumannii]MDC5369885.1 ester cyclase [Acinetobacter baumannii]MDC5669108.1 ester cyclase [Acinetobacter baumannii]MDR9562791.1 hypothetical protein [Acinetobacter baumannii]
MNYVEFENLTSEVLMLENLLKEIPEENIFDRFSIEKRLKSAKTKLGNINPYHLSKKAKLTFRGPHVVGSESISALFASQATMLFSDAVAAISAALTGNLSYKGKIPKKLENQLMITGMATGSFGFEFDLPKPDDSDLYAEPPIVETALEEISKLFQTSALGTDEELIDVISEVHPRAAKTVFNFLKFLQDQNSLCGFEFSNKFFRFSDQEQLARSISRLDSNNIHESIQPFRGEFQGILPNSRSFEFRSYEEDRVIRGKVDSRIEDPDVINREWLHKAILINIIVTQVGDSQPRYSIDDLENIQLI